MAVFTISNVKGSGSLETPRNHDVGEVRISQKWALTFNSSIVTHFDMAEWDLIWYGELNTAPNPERVVDFLNSSLFSELWGIRGVLIAIKKHEPYLFIFNDAYGSFPVFYSELENPEQTVASSSLKPFTEAKVDWVSFYQFLSFGYVIGGHSLFQGVSRLNANSGLEIRFHESRWSIIKFPLKNFWCPDQKGLGQKTDDLIDIMRSETLGFSNVQLMMSGGWDSRLLLSVLADKNPTLFTHGDLKSREISIVRDIAYVFKLPLIEQSLSEINFHSELFNKYLFSNESAMFTHWSAAGQHAQSNDLIMTAGTFGEVLGGHYGTLNLLPGTKKYFSLFMHMVGLGATSDNALRLHDPATVINNILMSNYSVFWFLNKDLFRRLMSERIIDESNSRLERVFQSYVDQGMADAQSMFERYYTEHRGGQYINLQLTNAAEGFNYRNIFTNRDLVQTVASIPFGYRAHNKVNKAIIKKTQPKLLEYPMAATLANGARPLLIQEGSRALRKSVEKSPLMRLYYKKHSRYGDRSFGWNNFRPIVHDELLEELSSLLSKNIWDHKELHKAISDSDGSNSYPLFDMLSKAVTLDYFLRGKFSN